ncbi:MAG: hypothetical protein ACPGFA_05305 [Pikeienuella sp.]
MTHADLETVYEALARKIDEVGPDKADIYLAKLALLLAKQIGEAAPVLRSIDSAALSLEV